MRLYTVKNKNGIIVAWAGTIGDAQKAKKAHDAKSWQEQDVPTSKPELLDFLNKYAISTERL